MKTIKEMREERARLGARANAILTEGRTAGKMTAEQTAEFDRLHAEINSLAEQIRMAETQENLDRELAAAVQTPGKPGSTSSAPSEEDRATAFRSWVMGDPRLDIELSQDQLDACRRVGVNPRSRQINMQFGSAPVESRVLTTGTGSSGGYTIPTGFVNKLEIAMKQYGAVQESASTMRTDSGETLYMPTSNDTSNKGRLLGESTQFTKTDVVFGQMRLDAYVFHSDGVLVPVQLMQDSAFDLESFLAGRLAERIGRVKNDYFTTGSNSSQPNGIVTASTAGKTAASTTAITFPELVQLQHSVDEIYRRTSKWMFNDTVLANLKQLVDDDARPLWQAGMSTSWAVDAPDRILGKPYVVNYSMADPAASVKAVLFGDFTKYQIREVKDFSLQRLDELYAEYLQVGFHGWVRCDGDLLDAGTHPVKHLVMAAS